ncbi:hypothetical protein V6Z11_A13G210300 [Gossypium hirsutum]
MCQNSNREFLFHKLDIFKIRIKDKQGHKILRIIGKLFPTQLLSVDIVKKYLEEHIFPRLRKKTFLVLYVHTGVQRIKNFPGISALRWINEAIPINVRDILQTVYFLNRGLQPHLFLATFGHFLLS